MLVTMIVRDGNDREVERYTAPDGSWIQTDSIGSQHIPAITDLTAYTFRGYSVYLIPESPPKIPEEIRKILDGRDHPNESYMREKARHINEWIDEIVKFGRLGEFEKSDKFFEAKIRPVKISD